MKKPTRVTKAFTIPENVYKVFQDSLKANGISVSAKIEELIRGEINHLLDEEDAIFQLIDDASEQFRKIEAPQMLLDRFDKLRRRIHRSAWTRDKKVRLLLLKSRKKEADRLIELMGKAVCKEPLLKSTYIELKTLLEALSDVNPEQLINLTNYWKSDNEAFLRHIGIKYNCDTITINIMIEALMNQKGNLQTIESINDNIKHLRELKKRLKDKI